MQANRKPATDGVFAFYAKRRANLTVQLLDPETILVEGDRVGFEFLGELLLAYARSNEHAVQFGPNGAGRARFGKDSTLGFYFHRLPCTEKDGKLSRPRRSAKLHVTDPGRK